MKAVNLIPGDQRSDASVGAGRSGGAAYALLVAVAAVALMAFMYGKASRRISSEHEQVATLTAEAQRAQAQANELAPYTSFVALREQRAQAVATLVDSRFDWAHVFHEFGRVLTAKTSIASLTGTIGPAGGSASTATASTTSSTSATPPGSVPTFALTGCATSQDAVAEMLQRLRLIDGVSEVNLQSSASGGAGSGGSSGGACPGRDPSFSVGVTFDPLPSASAASAAATQASTVSDETAGSASASNGSSK